MNPITGLTLFALGILIWWRISLPDPDYTEILAKFILTGAMAYCLVYGGWAVAAGIRNAIQSIRRSSIPNKEVD